MTFKAWWECICCEAVSLAQPILSPFFACSVAHADSPRLQELERSAAAICDGIAVLKNDTGREGAGTFCVSTPAFWTPGGVGLLPVVLLPAAHLLRSLLMQPWFNSAGFEAGEERNSVYTLLSYMRSELPVVVHVRSWACFLSWQYRAISFSRVW